MQAAASNWIIHQLGAVCAPSCQTYRQRAIATVKGIAIIVISQLIINACAKCRPEAHKTLLSAKMAFAFSISFVNRQIRVIIG
jgi:hypothetical protein